MLIYGVSPVQGAAILAESDSILAIADHNLKKQRDYSLCLKDWELSPWEGVRCDLGAWWDQTVLESTTTACGEGKEGLSQQDWRRDITAIPFLSETWTELKHLSGDPEEGALGLVKD